MVKDSQLSYLKLQGGTVELAKKLWCENIDDGLHDNFNFAWQREKFGKNFIDLPALQLYLSLIVEGTQDLTIIMLFAAAVVSLIIGMVLEEDNSTASDWRYCYLIIYILGVECPSWYRIQQVY